MSAGLPPCGDSERTNSRGDSRMTCEEGDVVQVHIHAEDAIDLHQIHLRRKAWSRRCDDTATVLLRAGAMTYVTSYDTDDMK